VFLLSIKTVLWYELFWTGVLSFNKSFEVRNPDAEGEEEFYSNKYKESFVACLWGSRCSLTLDIVSQTEGHDHQKSSKGLGSVSCSQEQFISSCVSSALIPLRKREK